MKARQAKFEEFKKTPEYAARVSRQETKRARHGAMIAAKKKTHLQAWVEAKTRLNGDRDALSIEWRNRILRQTSR